MPKAPEDLEPGDEYDGRTVYDTTPGNHGTVRIWFTNGTFTEKPPRG